MRILLIVPTLLFLRQKILRAQSKPFLKARFDPVKLLDTSPQILSKIVLRGSPYTMKQPKTKLTGKIRRTSSSPWIAYDGFVPAILHVLVQLCFVDVAKIFRRENGLW